jgi:3-oxoadipate enol-lactonase / 4-carboxymuconolactone decarboxylase
MPRIEANGTLLNYELSGPSGAPVVVFSNSLGTSLAMWDPLVPHLRGRYRVLRYDTRGHGASPVCDVAIAVEDLADDLIGLLDALAIPRAHVVGLSLGGMTGQAAASRHPDRVISLTLMATAAFMPSEASWNERADLVRAKGTAAIVEATMTRWFTPDFPAASPEAVAPVRQQFTDTDSAGYAVCCNAIGRMDLRPVLNRITAPTLVIAGRDDPSTPPAMAEEICAGIPHAELIVLPKAAHLLSVEQPAATAAHLLGFLDRHREAAETATGAVPFQSGLANRKSVLGEAHVERSLANATDFTSDFQTFITQQAWGSIWTRPGLERKARSMLTIAMLAALGSEELKLHIHATRNTGVTRDEVKEILLQVAVYAGVPAANSAFHLASQVYAEMDREDAAKG